ncbi:cytochrome p450 6k1 [Lasius niger]|uniref:Cytochrome p450 6k1 n=1 Tax=Lasius niger TaxID=67767 RepID=A0A0J7KBV7_LASNI|nr:cytochrome p450 6k1 [Lasius niger]
MAFITPYWILDGMIVLTASITVAYLYMTRKFKYWKERGVSEISPIPFLGNFTACIFKKKSPGRLLKEFYDQAKGQPYVGFFIFDKPLLLVRDHELVKNVLTKDFNHFSDRYFTPDETDRLGYANLFFIKNPMWRMLRLNMTSFFTPGKLKKMLELIDECAENLVEYLDSMNLGSRGKIMEVKELSGKFSTDVIGSTAFGLSTNSFKNPDAEFCKYGKMIFGPARSFEILAVTFMPLLSRLAGFTLFGKQTDAFMRKVFWETIAQRIKSGERRNDLIDILIELKKNHGDKDIEGFKFNGDDLLAQAGIFFAAGYETSATTMAFTLYELALHPEIQNRLREEILQALVKSDGKATYEMLMSLSYLDMVLFETLRIYPPLEYLQRLTTKVYNIPNSSLVIEKGTPIFISVRGLHFDPDYFPNPEKFDPERFNEDNKRNRPVYVHLPFGEGPHACIE